jgi:catechol 2,3-dioxygenase
MQQMTGTATLGHVAIVTQDPAAMAAFYRDLLGLEVTLQGSLPPLGDFAFLSGQPQTEFAELSFVTNPRAKHIALRVESLAALKAVYAEAKRRALPFPSPPLNHQVSLSLYLLDPDGNMLEVYWATGEKPAGPVAEPVDLERPETQLLALVQRRETVPQGGRP